jgi:hypothetical protein
MESAQTLTFIVLGAVLGAAGQGARAVVGIKKEIVAARSEGRRVGEWFDGRELVISFVWARLPACSGDLAVCLPTYQITRSLLLGFAGARYAGADFISGLMDKRIPVRASILTEGDSSMIRKLANGRYPCCTLASPTQDRQATNLGPPNHGPRSEARARVQFSSDGAERRGSRANAMPPYTLRAVRMLALAFPPASRRVPPTAHRPPVRGKFLARLKEDGESLADQMRIRGARFFGCGPTPVRSSSRTITGGIRLF